MSNQRLIEGENIKTHLAIVMPDPIIANSFVPKVSVYDGCTHIQDNQCDCNLTVYERQYDPHVYDPRFTGYCDDEWRAYNTDNGVKYFYGDVEATTLPHYIVRNNIPISFKSVAEQNFLDAQLEQRYSLQQSWLQQRASDRYQRERFPLHTMGKKL